MAMPIPPSAALLYHGKVKRFNLAVSCWLHHDHEKCVKRRETVEGLTDQAGPRHAGRQLARRCFWEEFEPGNICSWWRKQRVSEKSMSEDALRKNVELLFMLVAVDGL
jgi:hypothetical protein